MGKSEIGNLMMEHLQRMLGGQPVPEAPVELMTFEDDPEIKKYLLLLSGHDEDYDHVSTEFMIRTGRQDSYDFLKALVKDEDISPNDSYIIAIEKDANGVVKATSPFITVYRFLKNMKENELVIDGDCYFDIDQYSPDNDVDEPMIRED